MIHSKTKDVTDNASKTEESKTVIFTLKSITISLPSRQYQ